MRYIIYYESGGSITAEIVDKKKLFQRIIDPNRRILDIEATRRGAPELMDYIDNRIENDHLPKQPLSDSGLLKKLKDLNL